MVAAIDLCAVILTESNDRGVSAALNTGYYLVRLLNIIITIAMGSSATVRPFPPDYGKLKAIKKQLELGAAKHACRPLNAGKRLITDIDRHSTAC
jgi:hypothetical protein